FQAEDGIRDDLVTGVQTCALPISQGQAGLGVASNGTSRYTQGASEGDVASFRERVNSFRSVEYNYQLRDLSPNLKAKSYSSRTEIGRASCRERVKVEGGSER